MDFIISYGWRDAQPYDILKIFRELNVFGTAIYHPYRLTELGKEIIHKLRVSGSYSGGNWDIWHSARLYDNPDTFYLSPHIHLIMVGFVPSSFEERLHKMGYVLKNIRSVGCDSNSIGVYLWVSFKSCGLYG